MSYHIPHQPENYLAKITVGWPIEDSGIAPIGILHIETMGFYLTGCIIHALKQQTNMVLLQQYQKYTDLESKGGSRYGFFTIKPITTCRIVASYAPTLSSMSLDILVPQTGTYLGHSYSKKKLFVVDLKFKFIYESYTFIARSVSSTLKLSSNLISIREILTQTLI